MKWQEELFIIGKKYNIIQKHIDQSELSFRQYDNIIKHIKDQLDWELVFDNKEKISENLLSNISDKITPFYWSKIFENYSLTEQFIEKNKTHVHWHILIKNQTLSNDFINKHLNELTNNEQWELAYYQNIPEKLLKNIIDNNTKHHIQIQTNTPTSYSSYYWHMITKHCRLTENLLEYYNKKQCFQQSEWSNISRYQTLSENFIQKHSDKLDWWYISYFQELSEPFMKKFKNKLDIINVFFSQQLSTEFIQQIEDEIITKLQNYEYIDFDYIFINMSNLAKSEKIQFALIKHLLHKQFIQMEEILSPKVMTELKKQRLIFNVIQT